MFLLGGESLALLPEGAGCEFGLHRIKFGNFAGGGELFEKTLDLVVQGDALGDETSAFPDREQLDQGEVDLAGEFAATFGDLGLGKDHLMATQALFIAEAGGEGKTLRKGDRVVALAFVESDPVVADAQLEFGILEASRPSQPRGGPVDLDGGDL